MIEAQGFFSQATLLICKEIIRLEKMRLFGDFTIIRSSEVYILNSAAGLLVENPNG
jgi:hypothetical protein